MSVEKSEKDKVFNYIRTTGYPTELTVGNVLSRSGYQVDHSIYYLDKDEQKGREIDISAWKCVAELPDASLGVS